MMGHWFYGPSGGSWLGMGLAMVIQLIFWIFILYVAVRLLRGVPLGRPGNDSYFQTLSNNQFTAEDILKQRYAKGEITREQFEEMLNDIKEK